MKQALLDLITTKKRSLVLIGVLLLLNVGLYAMVTAYQSPALVSARDKWRDLRDRVTALGRSDVASAFRQGKSDLEKVTALVPSRRQFARVLGDLIEAAASSGVAPGGITYRPQVVKDEHLLAYSVTMSVNGRYAAVKSYLADLQKYREMVVIDGITLSNTDLYEENVTMDVRMTVYLREDA